MTRRYIVAPILALVFVSVNSTAATLDQIAEFERRVETQQRQLDDLKQELQALKAAAASLQGGAPAARAADEAPAEVDSRYIQRKNENLSLTFSGRVHRMVLNVDDGANTDLFFTDSEQGPTMLRFDANGRVSDSLSLGATLETGIRQNRPFLVSQDKSDGGTDVTVRIAEAHFDSARFGRLSLGRGFAAAWLAPEMDLSGTQFASLLPVGMLAPGMKFVNANDNSLSDVQVLQHFVDVERLLLVDRARYDSPRFGTGLQVSGSVASDGRWDIALRAKPRAGKDWTFVGGASFQEEPFTEIDRRQDAVFSVRHNSSGLNLTVGGSIENLTGGRDANTWLVKAGWLTDIVSLGKTAFSIDYYATSDIRIAGDEAQSIGLFAVQKWPTYGLDFYAGYRRYDVRRPDIDLKALDIIALGLALNF